MGVQIILQRPEIELIPKENDMTKLNTVYHFFPQVSNNIIYYSFGLGLQTTKYFEVPQKLDKRYVVQMRTSEFSNDRSFYIGDVWKYPSVQNDT